MNQQDNSFLIVGYLSLILLIFTLINSYLTSQKKTEELKEKYKVNLREKKKDGPFLLVIYEKYYMAKQLINYSLIIELLYLYISNNIIKESYDTFTHSTLYDSKSSYFDFNVAFDFYQQQLVCLFIVIFMITVINGNITINWVYNLLLLIIVILIKLALDSHRLITYKATFIISSVQIIYYFIILCLITYLFLFSSKLQYLMIFINNNIINLQNQVYEQYNEQFKLQNESTIISKTEKLLKAFNVYHKIKNIRQNLNQEWEKGRNFFVIFVFAITIFLYLNNFRELKTLYTQGKPLFSQIEINQLQDIFNQQYSTKQLEKAENNLQKPNVIVYILSGINYNTFKSQVYNPLSSIPSIQQDTRLFKLQSQLPSSSISNWISLFSGSKPELHGIFGNSMTLDFLNIDNIFAQMEENDSITSMVFGSDFFEDVMDSMFTSVKTSQHLVDRSFRRLVNNIHFRTTMKTQKINLICQFYQQSHNQAFLSYTQVKQELITYKQQYQGIMDKINNNMTIDKEDQFRFNEILDNIKRLLNDTKKLNKLIQNNYFLVFQDDDIQNKYLQNNQKDIESNLMEKQQEIQKLIENLSENSILMITSDHGNIQIGGSGGPEKEATEIPLMVYSKNSNFRSELFSYYSQDIEKEYQIIDLTATISSLIGIQVPNMNQGKFIDEILQLRMKDMQVSYHQLFNQKKHFMNTFLKKFNITDSYFDTIFKIRHQTMLRLEKEQINQYIDYMQDLFEIHKIAIQNENIHYNIKNNPFVLILLQLFFLLIVQQFTFADSISIFQNLPIKSDSFKINLHSFKQSFIVFAIYFGINLIGFLLYYFFQGYIQWSLTIIPSALYLKNYLFFIVIKPLLINILLIHYIFYYFSIWKNQRPQTGFKQFYETEEAINNADDQKTIIKYCNRERLIQLSIDELNYQKYGLAKVYLVRIYLIFQSITLGFVIVFFQGSVNNIFNPYEMQTAFIEVSLQSPRFIIAYFQFINIILLVMSTISLFYWPEWSLTRTIFDSIYLLRELKLNKVIQSNKIDYKSQVMNALTSQFVTNHTNIDLVKIQKIYIQKYHQQLKEKNNHDNHDIIHLNQQNQNQIGVKNDETFRKHILGMIFEEIDKIELDVKLVNDKQNYDNEAQALQTAIYDLFVKFKQDKILEEQQKKQQESNQQKQQSDQNQQRNIVDFNLIQINSQSEINNYNQDNVNSKPNYNLDDVNSKAIDLTDSAYQLKNNLINDYPIDDNFQIQITSQQNSIPYNQQNIKYKSNNSNQSVQTIQSQNEDIDQTQNQINQIDNQKKNENYQQLAQDSEVKDKIFLNNKTEELNQNNNNAEINNQMIKDNNMKTDDFNQNNNNAEINNQMIKDNNIKIDDFNQNNNNAEINNQMIKDNNIKIDDFNQDNNNAEINNQMIKDNNIKIDDFNQNFFNIKDDFMKFLER